MNKLIANRLRTPDGTIIRSYSRHDYVTHTDANGKEYVIDGGLDYVRCSAHGDEEVMTVTLDDTHDVVREACVWGTRGIDGDQPLTHVKLCDMDTDHIVAALEYASNAIRSAMHNELEYRQAQEVPQSKLHKMPTDFGPPQLVRTRTNFDDEHIKWRFSYAADKTAQSDLRSAQSGRGEKRRREVGIMKVIAWCAKAVNKYIRDSVLEYEIRSARRSIRKLRMLQHAYDEAENYKGKENNDEG